MLKRSARPNPLISTIIGHQHQLVSWNCQAAFMKSARYIVWRRLNNNDNPLEDTYLVRTGIISMRVLYDWADGKPVEFDSAVYLIGAGSITTDRGRRVRQAELKELLSVYDEAVEQKCPNGEPVEESEVLGQWFDYLLPSTEMYDDLKHLLDDDGEGDEPFPPSFSTGIVDDDSQQYVERDAIDETTDAMGLPYRRTDSAPRIGYGPNWDGD